MTDPWWERARDPEWPDGRPLTVQQRRRARWILAAVLVAAFLFGALWPYVLVHT